MSKRGQLKKAAAAALWIEQLAGLLASPVRAGDAATLWHNLPTSWLCWTPCKRKL